MEILGKEKLGGDLRLCSIGLLFSSVFDAGSTLSSIIRESDEVDSRHVGWVELF